MASKYIQMFPIPEGFPEILNDLAKEVIRNQPEDIIDFAAMYFTCLQQGTILDYPRKGKNIPCDFKTSIPTLKIPKSDGETQKTTFEKKENTNVVISRNDNHNDENIKKSLGENINKSSENEITSPIEIRNISSRFVSNILSNSVDHFNKETQLLSDQDGKAVGHV